MIKVLKDGELTDSCITAIVGKKDAKEMRDAFSKEFNKPDISYPNTDDKRARMITSVFEYWQELEWAEKPIKYGKTADELKTQIKDEVTNLFKEW